jgi:membrane associated rhomboid family serine protease
MIPIRDAIRSKNFPAVNVIIIAINVLVFLWELFQGADLTGDLLSLWNPSFTIFQSRTLGTIYKVPTIPPFSDLDVSPWGIPSHPWKHVVSLYLRGQH